jgi:hypothetical protein
MGKSFRHDAHNPKWRKAKQQKQNKHGGKQEPTPDTNERDRYSPFDDPPEYHESFAGA